MTTWQNTKKAFDQQLALNLKQLENYPSHWKYLLDCIRGLRYKINRVIDVGCGVGIYYKLCKDYFPELKYIGIDYSDFAISLAMNHWNYPGFLNLDYAELEPQYFTENDFLVANALCDIREDGDECFERLLQLDLSYLLFQRVKLTTQPSFVHEYKAYGEINTVEFYHDQTQLSEIIAKHNYMSIWDLDNKKNNDYNIFLMKNPFIIQKK